MSRTFGVEFEVTAPMSRHQVVEAMRRHGLDAVIANYRGDAYHLWQVKEDGSLHAPGGRAPMEIVAPAMDWHDTAAVSNAYARLAAVFTECDIRVNASCGGHVHLSMRDLTADQVGEVVDTYTRRQRIHSDLARREPGQWCHRLDGLDGYRWAQRWNAGDPAYSDRYRTINPAHYITRGTLEFRQAAGFDNVEQALGWVGYLVAMVEAIGAGTLPLIRHGSSADDALARMTTAGLLAPHLADWLRGRTSTTTLADAYQAAASEARLAFSQLFDVQGLNA